jgi:hypothetical protein
MYGPNLEPSNYHLFPVVKDHLGSHKFQIDDDMTTGVQWLQLRDTNFCQQGMKKLMP